MARAVVYRPTVLPLLIAKLPTYLGSLVTSTPKPSPSGLAGSAHLSALLDDTDVG